MKKYRGKKRLATIEKQTWQKKFLEAQEAILSNFAYKAYEKLGPGMIEIELNDCIDLIIPGLNIPKLNYDCELTLDLNHPNNKYWLEKIKAYDPEKQYLINFRSYQGIRCWIRDLKLLSTEDFEREYAFANANLELMSQSDLYEKGLIDKLPDKVENHGIAIKRLKFEDPKMH